MSCTHTQDTNAHKQIQTHTKKYKPIDNLSQQTRIASLTMDSSPLFLVAHPKEVVRTFLKISPSIVKHNMVLGGRKLEERNKSPLEVKVSDFYTDDINQAVKQVNNLVSNGSNLFLIGRYAEIVLDNYGVINFDAFHNLSGDKMIDITPEELDLLLSYIDMAIFTRIETIKYLYKLIDPKANYGKKIDMSPYNSFRNKAVQPRTEFTILAQGDRKTRFLSSTQQRATLINSSGGVQPILLVDFKAFHNVDLTLGTTTKTKKDGDKNTKNTDDVTQEEEEQNLKKIGKIISELQTRVFGFLSSVNKAVSVGGKLNAECAKHAEEMISNNFKLLDIGKKLRYLIHIESERLKTTRESLLFSRPVVAIGLDNSKSKARFQFEHSKLSEFSEISIYLPRIMSYKLGSSKNLETQKYNKISIGPISLATEYLNNDTGITFNITSEKQKLSAPVRLLPKLLIVSCDFLSEQSRQAEKELVFFKHEDMVNIFKVPLKQKDLNGQFLAVDTSSLPNPPFYRVHKARTHLNSFKINVRDECGEFLSFARDTIMKINFCFRACNADRL